MVTRVYGLANGTEVIFSHAEGNAWEITVPWTDDGKYTAEIFAEDEAGKSVPSLFNAVCDCWPRTAGCGCIT